MIQPRKPFPAQNFGSEIVIFCATTRALTSQNFTPTAPNKHGVRTAPPPTAPAGGGSGKQELAAVAARWRWGAVF